LCLDWVTAQPTWCHPTFKIICPNSPISLPLQKGVISSRANWYNTNILFCNIEQILEDWRYIAMVIDRLQLYIFLSVTICGTVGILINAPHIFDFVDQDEIKRSIIGGIEIVGAWGGMYEGIEIVGAWDVLHRGIEIVGAWGVEACTVWNINELQHHLSKKSVSIGLLCQLQVSKIIFVQKQWFGNRIKLFFESL